MKTNRKTMFFLLLLLVGSGQCASVGDLKLNVAPDSASAQLNLKGGSVLRGDLGSNFPPATTVSPCDSADGGECWQYSNGNRLRVEPYGPSTSGVCKTVVWLSNDINNPPSTCWDTNDGNFWFGGGSSTNQAWPIHLGEITDMPQVTGGNNYDGSTNSIHNRIWFSTAGIAIKVEDNVPLFVSVSTGSSSQICFKADNKPPYRFQPNVPATLSYTLCYADNVKDLFTTIMPLFFLRPQAYPDQDLFKYPVWSTHPRMKYNLSSTALREFVGKMQTTFGSDKKGLLLIGNGWEPCSGEHQFSSVDFPMPRKFVDDLKAKGINVGLWVHPHVDKRCDRVYEEGYKGGYFVTDIKGQPAVSLWEGSLVASVDFTSSRAVDWWKARLSDLMSKNGLYNYYFDRGQASNLPGNYTFDRKVPLGLQPDIYATKYAEAAASFGNKGIVTVGRNSQQFPLMVRMTEKTDIPNINVDGLQTVIPSILQMGISGFPFVLPEVIGGSVYNTEKLPDRRTYIRWMQLSALLPVFHFSVGPWEYDHEVVDIAQKMMALREKHMYKIIDLLDAAVAESFPIIRPMWWTEPTDPRFLQANDQFMLGDDLVVAPIVTNVDQRDILLPSGRWRNNLKPNDAFSLGPTQLLNRKVELNELLTFSLVED